MAQYFTTKYFLPDKILTRRNIIQDHDWRCFFGEWKPVEVDSIYDHPDFKKIVFLMRGSLKELMNNLFSNDLLNSDTELDTFGSLSGGTKICFLRLYLVPKSSNATIFSYSFRLFSSEWYDINTSNGRAKAVSILLQIGKNCLNKSFNNEAQKKVRNISDTPTTSKSNTDPGLFDITNQSIMIHQFFPQRMLYEFKTPDEAIKHFSQILRYPLPVEEEIQKELKSSCHKTILNQKGRTLLFFTKEKPYELNIYPRGQLCPHPMNEIQLFFNTEGEKFTYRYWFLKVSMRTIEYIYSRIEDGNDQEDFEDENERKDDCTVDNSIDHNDNNNTSLFRLSQNIHDLDLGLDFSNLQMEKLEQKSILGTIQYKNKESYFKITNREIDNVFVMKLMKEIRDPNICNIFYYGPVNSQLNITVQEKLLNYDELIKKMQSNQEYQGNSIIRTIILKTLIGCLHALKCIHNKGIVHCDVSVHNIMFRMKTSYDFDAVLIDFNNSKCLNSNQQSILNYKDDYTPQDPNIRFTVKHDIFALSVVIKKIMANYSSVCEEICNDIHFEEYNIIPISNCIKKMSAVQYSRVTEVLDDVVSFCMTI